MRSAVRPCSRLLGGDESDPLAELGAVGVAGQQSARFSPSYSGTMYCCARLAADAQHPFGVVGGRDAPRALTRCSRNRSRTIFDRGVRAANRRSCCSSPWLWCSKIE